MWCARCREPSTRSTRLRNNSEPECSPFSRAGWAWLPASVGFAALKQNRFRVTSCLALNLYQTRELMIQKSVCLRKRQTTQDSPAQKRRRTFHTLQNKISSSRCRFRRTTHPKSTDTGSKQHGFNGPLAKTVQPPMEPLFSAECMPQCDRFQVWQDLFCLYARTGNPESIAEDCCPGRRCVCRC